MHTAAYRANVRKLVLLAGLAALAALAYLLVEVSLEHTRLFQYAMKLRLPKLAAMVVTAFSCFLAGMERLSAGTELHGRERVLRFFAVSLVAWGASLLGFGELISLIYPVFGAVSAVFLTGMAVHFCRVNWGNPNEKADGK